MTTYTFSDISNITPSSYPAVLTSSTTGTTAQWSLQYPHADGNYPDFEWDASNATNATLGWAVVGTNNGTISYNSTSGKIEYYINASWTHEFDPTEGRTASGPTVTTGRSSHSGIIPSASDFTIRNPNPGVWYEKTGAGKFKIKFYDQNEAFGGYNITISWTSLNNSAASHTETVSAASGDYYIEIDTLTNGVKHNSDITISFNQNTYFSGVFYTADTVLKTFTYLANGPFSGSFTPDSGNPNGSSITIVIQDDNIDPEGTRTLSYKEPDGTTANATLNSTNSWSFTTTFVNDKAGTAYIYKTDKDNQTSADVIASATYSWGSGNNGYPRDGYPIVMTNSFNRNRSIYAIGMTHKTATDPFL